MGWWLGSIILVLPEMLPMQMLLAGDGFKSAALILEHLGSPGKSY